MGRLVTLVLVFIALSGVAQDHLKNSHIYLKLGELDRAKEEIDEALKDPVVSKQALAWMYKGLIYHAIYESKESKYNSLSSSALNIAYEAYVATQQKDLAKEFHEDLFKQMTKMALQFFNEAVKYYNQQKFIEALSSFESALIINELPMINTLDTTLIFNAAKTADKAQQYDKAIDYYSKLINLNYRGPVIYFELANVYKSKGEKDKFIATLETGIKYYPNDNIRMISAAINHYLATGQHDQALVHLETATQKDPTNSTYFYVRGNIYDIRGDHDLAIAEYKKALEIDDKIFDAHYNLGVIYYNKAVKAIDGLNQITDRTEYDKEKEVVDALFKTSMEHYEKAYALKIDDQDTLEALEFLYSHFKMKDKHEEIKAKLGKE